MGPSSGHAGYLSSSVRGISGGVVHSVSEDEIHKIYLFWKKWIRLRLVWRLFEEYRIIWVSNSLWVRMEALRNQSGGVRCVLRVVWTMWLLQSNLIHNNCSRVDPLKKLQLDHINTKTIVWETIEIMVVAVSSYAESPWRLSRKIRLNNVCKFHNLSKKKIHWTG